MEDLAELLQINLAAYEFWSNLFFLFKSEQEIDDLKRECRGKERRYIDTYIRTKRLTLLKTREIHVNDFVSEFNNDRRAAMENLIQQNLSPMKISKLKCDDPTKIYSIYRKCPFGAGYADLLLALL
ncbi:hypothetical protein D3C73_278610 [compost metagenome]